MFLATEDTESTEEIKEMSYNPEKSLKNAKKLLDSPSLQDIVSLRMEPEPETMCCCSKCWPLVWQKVNDLIQPQGPVEHEGRAIVTFGNERCVLEQHESGPEIMLLVTASINLLSAVINLIVAVCSSLRKERKCPAKIKIVKRRFLRKRVGEDLIIEINLDDSKLTNDKMKGIIESAIKKSLVSKKY